MKKSEFILGLLRIPIDFMMALISFLVAYQLRLKTNLIPSVDLPLTPETFPLFNEYLNISLIGSLVLLGFFMMTKLYQLKNTISIRGEYGKIILACSLWLMANISYYFLIRDFPFSRLVLIYTWILLMLFTSLGRAGIQLLHYILLSHGIGNRTVAFIGDNKTATHLKVHLSLNPLYKISGWIGSGPHSLGSIKNLKEISSKYKINEIIQTKQIPELSQKHLLNFCRQHHIQYHFVPDVLEVHNSNVELQTISGIPLITVKPSPLEGWGHVIKRGMDIIGASCALIILSPLLLMIAIAIKIDSAGPILFSRLEDGQPTLRIGQFGQPFHFLKFRTMRHNTHQQRYHELADRNIRKNSPLVKIANDPRITSFGKFLRQTSLDELPQLWNVLKGDISLVGPRPHLPEEVAKYHDHHKFVLSIKPGLSGLAQISGRSDLDFEEEIQLDSYYIENWSPWLDLKILLKTLAVPFRKYKE